MPSDRSLSITAALILKTVYIYREILLIVKRFDDALKGQESGALSARDGLKHGSHRVMGQRRRVSGVRWVLLPASFSTNALKPSPWTSSIASIKLEKDDAIVFASGKCI